VGRAAGVLVISPKILAFHTFSLSPCGCMTNFYVAADR
jgi:hypothetical protein